MADWQRSGLQRLGKQQQQELAGGERPLEGAWPLRRTRGAKQILGALGFLLCRASVITRRLRVSWQAAKGQFVHPVGVQSLLSMLLCVCCDVCAQVVVGTPGRVFDMLRRRYLRADNIKMFTLDEADEMLSRGFKDQIYDIFQLLPPKLQVGTRERLGLGAHTAAVGARDA